jgi:hypothetical protein
MRCITPQPFMRPCRSTRKISRSGMPCNESGFFFPMCALSVLDREKSNGLPIGCQ